MTPVAARRLRDGYVLLLLATASPTWAQSPDPGATIPSQSQNSKDQTDEPVSSTPWGPLSGRLSLHINAAFQTSAQQVRETLSSRAYGEDATLRTWQEIDGGAIIDAGGRIRMWRQLEIGATYTQLNGSHPAVVSGSVPHPIQFSQPRAIEPQTVQLIHRERATHVSAAWVLAMPFDAPLDVTVFGGPSFFSLRQGLVTHVTVRETGGPPFATVSVAVDTGEHRRNGVGGHVGADVAFMVTSTIGLGFLVRYAAASVTLPSSISPAVSLKVGGFHAGGGLRLRF